MLIKQLSIFLENRKGRFTEVGYLAFDCVRYRQGYSGVARAALCGERDGCDLPALSEPAGSIGQSNGDYYGSGNLY